MARVTYVKRAQQRYETVPVLNLDGTRKQIPMISKRTKEQKVTKTGRPVFLTLTKADKTKPLPPEKCGRCDTEIKPGMPYKWIAPKSGPYGGRRLVRCEACPTWQVWEYSNSLSARIAQITNGFTLGTYASADDVSADLASVADEIRALAEEKHEAASNIEDGFGHPTSMSEELEDIAEQLESWADDIENAEIPDYPEPEEESCEECQGDGRLDQYTEQERECEQCSGTGQFTPDEPTEDQIEDWMTEVESACEIVYESPV